MLWKRYRWISLLSLPFGAVVGVVFMLGTILLSGVPFNPLHSLTALLWGSLLGVAAAAMALLGGFLCLLRWDRKLQESPSQRVWLGSIGSALGTLGGFALLGVFFAVDSVNLAVFMFFVPIGLIAGVCAGVLAGVAVSLAERAAAAPTPAPTPRSIAEAATPTAKTKDTR